MILLQSTCHSSFMLNAGYFWSELSLFSSLMQNTKNEIAASKMTANIAFGLLFSVS